MDVDNEADYKEMVEKIHSTTDLGTTKIFVDIKHVEKLPCQADSESGDEESGSSDNNDPISLSRAAPNMY